MTLEKLENFISIINENFFLKEFSFSKNDFSPPQMSELQFSDHVIWLDDLLITFQIKNREVLVSHTPEEEIKWFKNKILKEAKKQIKHTLNYLKIHREINITNERGHIFNVASANLKKEIHIILYSPHELLPEEYRRKKHYLSDIAGFIHLITAYDYVEVCRILITPAEISEYLEFRKDIISKWEKEVNSLPEQALVGQFLHGNFNISPSDEFIKYFLAFDQNRNEFDILPFLKNFPEQITTANNPYEYYKILAELAKLNRNELKEVKLRINLCVEKAKNLEYDKPYRFTSIRTGCCFVFIIIPLEYIKNSSNLLQAFTCLHKYDQQLRKCIGIYIIYNGEYFDIGWYFIEEDWVYNSEIERKLKNDFPFRPVEEVRVRRY